MNPLKTSVGTKLDANGNYLPFPGLSIISFVDTTSILHKKLCDIQEIVRNSKYNSSFSFLPPQSFHMTVFDLLCDQERTEEKWSNLYDQNTEIKEIADDFSKSFSSLSFPENMKMKIDGCSDIEITLKLCLTPCDDNYSSLLYDFRNQISKITGIRHKNHDNYKFHISLAYLRDKDIDENEFNRFISNYEELLFSPYKIISLNKPEFVYFPNMTSFIPIKKAAKSGL